MVVIRIVKSILLHIWAMWCIIVMTVLCSILFPLIYMAVMSGRDSVIRAAHRLPLLAARMGLRLMGVRLDVRHGEIPDPAGQYVYISNHRSLLDPLIAGAVIPNYLKFLGKTEMLRWPVLGYLLGKFYVPVQRNEEADRKKSMDAMVEKMRTGCSFFICPEGTCNRGPELLTHFHSGAFRLAAETGVPLVPLTFVGAGERMPRDSYLLYPGTVTVYCHPAIAASEFQETKLTEGKERVINMIKADLLAHYPSGKYE